MDKVLPQLAFLAEDFSEACSPDKFMQADAGREQSLERIFTPKTAAQYDYVFNCGGETRYSQDDSVYVLRSVDLTVTLARECARRRTPAYVEFSTGMVYKPPSSSTISGGGSTETAAIKPWLRLARSKLVAEEELGNIAKEFRENGRGELRYTILRLPHVYGDYDVGFLARGLCMARVYQSKGDEMKWLYGRDLRVNTVHVLDVTAAAWLAAGWAARGGARDLERKETHSDRIFNIVDDGDTSQGDIASLVGAIFETPTGFQNTLVSAFAKLNLDHVVDEVNDEVLQPWADLLREHGITRPGPIGPFMEKELLRDCHLCLNNTKAKRTLGWAPGQGREKLSKEAIEGVVRSYKRMGWWP